MTNLLEQAINCEDGNRAAKIIEDALGIENAALAKCSFATAWPADREQRARILCEWLLEAAQGVPTGGPEQREPSCFALEEERGGNWKGAGAARAAIKDAKPSL